MELSMLSLLTILLVAWMAGIIANRIGFPAILGELAAGIIIGPALLGQWGIGFEQAVPGLDVLAQIGVFALMLYIGMEVDYRDMLRCGKAGLLGAIGGFIVPFGAGYLMAYLWGAGHGGGLFLGLAMAVTSLATKSRILADLNLFGTRIANVLLSGALLADVGALVVFALAIGIVGPEGFNAMDLVLVVVKAILFFAIAIVLGVKVLPFSEGLLQRLGMSERTGSFTYVMLVALVYAELAHLLGLHAIVGAFMAGAFMRRGVLRHQLSHEIASVVRDMSLGFLAPIFFVTVGFHVSLDVVFAEPVFVILVIAAATLAKIFGTAGFYVFSGNGWREGMVIGAGMNGRGAVEIIIAEIALGLGIIDANLFSALVLMAFFTTLTVPIGLKLGVKWLEKHGELARMDDEREGIVIVGADALGRAVAQRIRHETKEPVCLIDTNPDHCRAAQEEGLEAIRGSATREEVLILAGAREASTLLAMTTNATINSLVAQRARELFGIPRVRTARPSPEEESAIHGSTLAPIWPHLEGAHLLDPWTRVAGRHPAQTETVEAEETETWSEACLRLAKSRALLPLFIRREDRARFAAEDDKLKPGDEIICMRRDTGGGELTRRFAESVAMGTVLDFQNETSFETFLVSVAGSLSSRLDVTESDLADSLREREREFSTVLVPGMAIPHVSLPGVIGLHIALVRAEKGIAFPDQNEPVTMAFVLIGSEEDRQMHLHALSTIARLAESDGFEQAWRQAKTTDDLRQHVLDLCWSFEEENI
ncbi:cation:proton antiporter [bacterium]|nr:cation:proton antiporter [bacterium]